MFHHVLWNFPAPFSDVAPILLHPTVIILLSQVRCLPLLPAGARPGQDRGQEAGQQEEGDEGGEEEAHWREAGQWDDQGSGNANNSVCRLVQSWYSRSWRMSFFLTPTRRTLRR